MRVPPTVHELAQLPGLRRPRARVRAGPLRRLRVRSAGRVRVQGAGGVPVVPRATHGRRGGAPGGSRAAARTLPAVDPVSAVAAARCARARPAAPVGSTDVLRARGVPLAARAGAGPRHRVCVAGGGDRDPALRLGAESQRPLPHPRPRRRRVRPRRSRAPGPLRRATWPAVPPYKVGDEVIVTGTWLTSSPHGENNTEGLLVYSTLKNITQGWEAPPPDPNALPPATIAPPAH